MKYSIKQCLFCKISFDRPLRSRKYSSKISLNEYKRRKFCSLKCKGLSEVESKKGDKNPNWQGGKKQCSDCDNKLSVGKNSRKIVKRCNKCCYNFTREHPEKNPRWKGGKDRFTCYSCHKIIDRYAKHCYPCISKLGMRKGKNSPAWKEKLTCYKYLHKWIRDTFGNPRKCEHCGFTSKNNRAIHWANKTGKYLRDRNDWIKLCVRCHKIYDLKVQSTSSSLVPSST